MTSSARGRLLPVLLATAALVGAANLGAYAAAGHPLLLGAHNHAAATTTVTTRGRAPALTLHTSRKAPPLAVSSGRLVKHLNADRVDGLDAADLGSRAITYRLPAGPTGDCLRLPPPGTYLVTVSVTLAAADPNGCFLEEIGGAGERPDQPQRDGERRLHHGRRQHGVRPHQEGAGPELPLLLTDLRHQHYSSTVALVRIPTHAQGRLLTRTR